MLRGDNAWSIGCVFSLLLFSVFERLGILMDFYVVSVDSGLLA